MISKVKRIENIVCFCFHQYCCLEKNVANRHFLTGMAFSRGCCFSALDVFGFVSLCLCQLLGSGIKLPPIVCQGRTVCTSRIPPTH
jgi:hypothetical protein